MSMQTAVAPAIVPDFEPDAMPKPFLTTRRGVLYAADCLDIMGRLKSRVFDTIFADPPFNLGKDYKNGYDDQQSDHGYMAWCRTWIRECCRLVKPGGAFFLYALPALAVEFAPILGEELDFRHWIALTMKGGWRRGQRLYPAHYALLYYTRGVPRVFHPLRVPIEVCRHCNGEIRDYGGHRNKMNPEGVNLTDFWTDTSPNRHRKYKVRPGVNELKLVIPERAILLSTDPGDLVFDPFGGGGSTYQAAEKHHRRWLGTELHDAEHIGCRLADCFPESVSQATDFDAKELFKA